MSYSNICWVCGLNTGTYSHVCSACWGKYEQFSAMDHACIATITSRWGAQARFCSTLLEMEWT